MTKLSFKIFIIVLFV